MLKMHKLYLNFKYKIYGLCGKQKYYVSNKFLNIVSVYKLLKTTTIANK